MVDLVWGEDGIQKTSQVDVVVVVDVLSFSTAVVVAVGRGTTVVPSRVSQNSPPRGAPGSLSPHALRHLSLPDELVLWSDNGAAVAKGAGAHGGIVLAGALINAAAVGQVLRSCDRATRVVMAAAGERCSDGSLRYALEDLLGCGAILSHLDRDQMLPAARSARDAYESLAGQLDRSLAESASGIELRERGFSQDVAIASDIDAIGIVPMLRNGAFHLHPTAALKDIQHGAGKQ
ncbi:2-phosphosulfolactate phosphatase [Sulfobacillus harzensis]|uniref:Probable 2-phosphosulfolactate phosphatase n=1 Tax=Sulfobacillus harzensis TaxID=2729629 RepID=A0A7Y0L7I5_9FIRM|nr:2-phosphosulfolactate phosphatase [Sulfobacillus harzensis]NMP24764.1 hypothetical protein [Sulfobacillus harzensis]